MTLKQLQMDAGAIFSPSQNTPISFSEKDFSLSQILENVTLCDRTHWGLLQITGCDRTRFLHNQSTNDIQSLSVGQGCNSVFVTSTGRNIDLVSVYVREEDILLLVSPSQNQILMQWMDRYIFPFDKVEIKDISQDYHIFTLMGNESKSLLSSWVDKEFLESPEFSHKLVRIDDIKVMITVGCDLKFTGYNLIISKENSSLIWQKITEKKVNLIGSETWEKIRILRGRPKINQELTDDFNPLETGLWQSVSFEKGCYIGQETIARLNTYNGVKQKLWGIKLKDSINIEDNSTILVQGEKVGKITSYTEIEKDYFALGYIRTKAGGEGLVVNVGEVEGEVVSLPFISHKMSSN